MAAARDPFVGPGESVGGPATSCHGCARHSSISCEFTRAVGAFPVRGFAHRGLGVWAGGGAGEYIAITSLVKLAYSRSLSPGCVPTEPSTEALSARVRSTRPLVAPSRAATTDFRRKKRAVTVSIGPPGPRRRHHRAVPGELGLEPHHLCAHPGGRGLYWSLFTEKREGLRTFGFVVSV